MAPEIYSSLVTKSKCSSGAPYVGCMGPSFVADQLLSLVWKAFMVPGPVACQTLPCVETAGHWLEWAGHKVAVSGNLGASGLLLVHWLEEVVLR